MPSSSSRRDALQTAIEARRDELIALTQDLVRIPTINPPGEAYLEISEYVGARLKRHGFQVEMVRAEVAKFGATVEVRPFSSLLMHFAEELDATVIVRGLRAVSDFEYEFQMTAMNQRLNADIETVFLMADPRHQAIASRLVKEIARLDGAIDSFVSPTVAERVRAKVKGQ